MTCCCSNRSHVSFTQLPPMVTSCKPWDKIKAKIQRLIGWGLCHPRDPSCGPYVATLPSSQPVLGPWASSLLCISLTRMLCEWTCTVWDLLKLCLRTQVTLFSSGLFAVTVINEHSVRSLVLLAWSDLDTSGIPAPSGDLSRFH